MSVDRVHLGEVVSAGTSSFVITRSKGAKVTLRNDAVYSVADGTVTLVCNAARVHHYEMHNNEDRPRPCP